MKRNRLEAIRACGRPAVVAWAAAFASGCIGPDSFGPDTEETPFIEVVPSRATVAVGETTVLAAATLSRALTWTSSATAVAEVDESGVATGLSEGSADITVTDGGGRTATMTLTVGARDVIWEAVTVGRDGHGCGLATDGRAFCWGDALRGRVGNGVAGGPPGAAAFFHEPAPVAGDLRFVSLSAGRTHTCGLVADGRAFCWGQPPEGAGMGGFDSATPAELPGGVTFASLSAGDSHTCGLTAAGAAYCWGGNEVGELGDGSTQPSSVPVAVSGGLTFESISAGNTTTCAVAPNGDGYCWGAGRDGQLGGGSFTDSSVPVPVQGGIAFAHISLGRSAVCGVSRSDERYCWGLDPAQAEGDGERREAAPVSAGDFFTSISLGVSGGCGVDWRGRALCWGGAYSDPGVDLELGNFGDTPGPMANEPVAPVALPGGYRFSSVSAGNLFACAVTETQRVFCWGRADGGRLGNGSTRLTYVAIPIQVSDP